MTQPVAHDEFQILLLKRLHELSIDLFDAHAADLRARGFKPQYDPQAVPIEKPVVPPQSIAMFTAVERPPTHACTSTSPSKSPGVNLNKVEPSTQNFQNHVSFTIDEDASASKSQVTTKENRSKKQDKTISIKSTSCDIGLQCAAQISDQTIYSLATMYSERQKVAKHGYSSRGQANVSEEDLSMSRKFVRRIVLSHGFDAILGIVIMLNAASMGVETNQRLRDGLSLHIVEYVFLAIYTLELLLRVCAVGIKSFIRNPLMLFDCFLVIAGIVDLITSSKSEASPGMAGKMFRFFRLQRLARLFRLCFMFQSMWSLVEGLMAAIPFLSWTSFLVLIIIYVYAIAGMDLISGTADYGEAYEAASRNFDQLGMAMLTLLQLLTLDNISEVYRPIIEARPFLAVYFLSFMLIVSVALVNLVTAKMVEVTQLRASQDLEGKAAWQKARIQAVMPAVRKKFEEFDIDDSGTIPYKEFLQAPKEIQDFIVNLCNLRSMEDIFKLVDYDDDGVISLDEFISGVVFIHEGHPIELMRLLRDSRLILTEISTLQKQTRQLVKKPRFATELCESSSAEITNSLNSEWTTR